MKIELTTDWGLEDGVWFRLWAENTQENILMRLFEKNSKNVAAVNSGIKHNGDTSIYYLSFCGKMKD